MTRVCLSMIVKNEAHVIRRCLDSVRPFVSNWVIVDTGSTDGTQQIVREQMRQIPGELLERPWRDFGTNRTEALALARGRADYVLVMDADHVLHAPAGFRFDGLSADAYHISHVYADVQYGLPILLADRIAFRYEGVLHEYITADVPFRTVPLAGPWVEVFHEGARSRDPKTYAKDAEILANALEREPGNVRYAFYLAQSLKDAGKLAEAREAYQRRASMGGWDEEVWYSRFEAARLAERLALDPAQVVHEYLAAYQLRPHRAEPLVALARIHRGRGQYALAHLFASRAASMPQPDDLLFVDQSAYRWRALDELGTAAYYAGDLATGRRALETLLAGNALPASERPRVAANLAFYPPAPVAAPKPIAQASHTLPRMSVYVVSPPGYAHRQAFEEVAIGLQHALAEIGVAAPVVYTAEEIEGRAIVLGANALQSYPGMRIPDDAIVFNLEQASSTNSWFGDKYLALLRSHEVWDYSERNVSALAGLGVANVRHCPIGYSEALERIESAAEGADVLIYGAFTERRTGVADAIEAAGVRVERLFNVYGRERDKRIARARIVVNAHAHDAQVFEIVRVSYLLANRRFVISETGRDRELERPFAEAGGIVFGSAEEIPALCRRYLQDGNARREVAQRGYEAFRKIRQADALRALLR